MYTGQFQDVVIEWAKRRTSIKAIGVLGSYARGTAKSDSDIDLIIVDEKPSELIEDASWINQFGSIKSMNREDYGLVQSLRVFYNRGQEVEFGITGVEWCSIPIDNDTGRVIADGLLILFDPLDLLAQAKNWVAGRNES